MPVFSYKAMDASGRQVSGIVDAENAKAARLKLRKENKFPTEIVEADESKGPRIKGRGLSMEINFKFFQDRVKIQELAVATRQLSTLLGASIPLFNSLNALIDQLEHEKLKRIFSQVREKVNEGTAFANALKEFPKVFSPLYVNMVHAGESSGTLDLVLDRLSDFLEASVALRNKIRTAMIYPLVMSIFGTGVVIYLVTFVVPQVSKIFEGMHKALPTVTLALLGISSFFRNWWFVLVFLGVGGWVMFKRWTSKREGKLKWHTFLLKTPVFGPLIRKVAVARFTRTLSTLLKSGVPIITAFDIVKNIVNNLVLQDAIEAGRENIKEGESIAKPLERSKAFPPMVIHMIAVGEQTGELEDMLLRVSNAYENEIETAINSMTALFEPIMIVVMGGFVAFAVMAIILPIMDMTQGLH
jgi:general secretion pathway protein F